MQGQCAAVPRFPPILIAAGKLSQCCLPNSLIFASYRGADASLNRGLAQPRQPLFLAAAVFSAGIWIGFHAWRPPAWWMIAILVCGLGAGWFVGRRAWLAKTLALAAWFFFGAFLIQVRGRPAHDPRLPALADGGSVIVTAHVIREG